jgi:hypothetical protein
MAIPDHLLPSIDARPSAFKSSVLANQIQSALLDLPGAITTQALLRRMGQPVNRSNQTAAGIVLTRLGYQKTRLRFDGERGYIYRPPVA